MANFVVKIISQLKLISERYRKEKLKNMNTIEFKGNWNEQKGKLKQKFAMLTDDDLMFEEGKEDEMMGKIQIKLGKTKEEIQKIIADL
jgi:uncharacterized protein YjbJ (UPF0337 family)